MTVHLSSAEGLPETAVKVWKTIHESSCDHQPLKKVYIYIYLFHLLTASNWKFSCLFGMCKFKKNLVLAHVLHFFIALSKLVPMAVNWPFIRGKKLCTQVDVMMYHVDYLMLKFMLKELSD